VASIPPASFALNNETMSDTTTPLPADTDAAAADDAGNGAESDDGWTESELPLPAATANPPHSLPPPLPRMDYHPNSHRLLVLVVVVVVVAHSLFLRDQALRNSVTSLGHCQRFTRVRLVRFVGHLK